MNQTKRNETFLRPRSGCRDVLKLLAERAEVLAALRELAARNDVTMTEALRRAISILKFLQDAQGEGKDLLLRDPQTKEIERIIFP